VAHLGRGDGTFYPEVTDPASGGWFYDGAQGDFNGDGAVGLAYQKPTGGVAVVANDNAQNLAGAVTFQVTAPATTTSGSVLPMAITPVDANGNVATGFRGTVAKTGAGRSGDRPAPVRSARPLAKPRQTRLQFKSICLYHPTVGAVRTVARGSTMSRRWLLLSLVAVASLGAVGLAQKPAPTPATPEAIEAAFRISLAAAAEYELRVGRDGSPKPLELVRESRLKWSNPAASDIQGNVFVWTRDGRPLVVGCFMRWFSPRSVMQHEFHSLAEEPLEAKFHGAPVWATREAGLTFADVPGAPPPAAGEAQRGLQLKALAKEFSAVAKYRGAPDDTQLRLLPQPIHGYAAPKAGVLSGGLFAFVRGTDPELFLLVEARGKDAAAARWQFAATRMTNMAELQLRHHDRQVWEAGLLPWQDVSGSHERPYTAFEFKEIPDFLKDAAAKPKP
jgi:hypothetical protein